MNLSHKAGVSYFMTLLAAFYVLLYRYSGQADLPVGVPIANRRWLSVEELIGTMLNTLVMRVELSGHPSFQELLGRVKQVALGAYANQDMPFERLVAGITTQSRTEPYTTIPGDVQSSQYSTSRF